MEEETLNDGTELQDGGEEEEERGEEGTELIDLYLNALQPGDHKVESDEDDGELFNKNTESFRCLTQMHISRSSLLRHPLYHFPPLKDPGVEEAFNYVEPAPPFDTVGCETYLRKCKIFQIIPLSRVLKFLPTEILDLMYYGLTENQINAIMEALKVNSSVTELILQDNWLTLPGVQFLSDALSANTSIVYLNLQECKLKPEGALLLSEGILNTTSLRELNLSYNSLGNEGLKNLEYALIENYTIAKLNLSNNNFGEDSGDFLGNIVSKSNNLVDLDISWNRFFTMKGNKGLFGGLCVNTSIKYLNIAWNGIGAVEAVAPIMRYLRNSKALQYFDISNNRLTDAALRSVRFGIMTSVSLIRVKIGNNPITSDEAKNLVTVFNRSPSLVYLDMENIFVQKDFIKIWDKFTKIGKSIRIGGVLSNYPIYGPDTNSLLLRRAKYLAMKAKSKKAQKDFGHFVLKLPEENITKQEFMNLADNFKAKKVDKDLVTAIGDAFPFKKDKVDCVALRDCYMGYFPDTALPPPKPKKEKLGKKGKGKDQAKVPTGADGVQSIVGDEGEDEGEEGASENQTGPSEEEQAVAGEQPAPTAEGAEAPAEQPAPA